MTITNFIPTFWAGVLLKNLQKEHVFASLLNRDYEGEIKSAGDTVKINSIGRITVNDYTRNAGAGGTAATPTIAGINRPEILVGSSLFLTIDQAKYFNFEIDDADKWQQKPKLGADAMAEAAYAMAEKVDLYCASTLQTGVSGTTDGTGNRLTARTIGVGSGDDDAYETLVDLGVKLDENDVPMQGRWVVVPPWFYGALLKDVRFTNYGTAENRGALANGIVGRTVNGFEVHKSNNLSGATSGTLAVAGGVYTVLAGVKQAATFAEQIDKVEAFRPPDGFNDAVKGLHLFGAKVTRPFALASVAATAAA